MNPPEPVTAPAPRPRWRQAALFAAGLMLLQALPWGLLLAQRVSIVAFATESVGYRYFHSYRLLHGDKSAIWEAQGQTLGVFHHGLNSLLSLAGVEQLRSRLDAFGYGTLAFSAVLWGAVCLLLGRLPGIGWRDRWLLALVGLFGFYGCFWGRASALLPDYYTWEVIATVACAGLFVAQLHQPETSPRAFRAAALGVLAGLMAGIKFTLLPTALLPVLPWLMQPGAWTRLGPAAAAWLGGAVVTLGLVLSTYYLFDFAQLGQAFAAWRSFVAAPGAEPGFVTRLLNPFATIRYPWDDHQFFLFICLLWVVALGTLVSSARSETTHRRRLAWLGTCVVLGSALHAYAVCKRPAETTLFESALFLAAGGGLMLVALPPSPRGRRTVAAWALLLAGWCLYSAARYAPSASTYAQLRETSRNTWALHDWLNATGRPVLVVFPDNRYVTNTVEECLMKGFSDTPTWNITAGQVLLDRVAPRRKFVQQLETVPPDHVVVWTEIPGQPPVPGLFPALQPYAADAKSWALPREFPGPRFVRTSATPPPPAPAKNP